MAIRGQPRQVEHHRRPPAHLRVGQGQALALLGAGCGDDDEDDGGSDGGDSAAETGDGGDDGDGRDLFIQTCGGCHTLDDAGTAGQIGPVLTGGAYDAATVEDVIETGRGSMPAGLLAGDDAAAVAEYVSEASQ